MIWWYCKHHCHVEADTTIVVIFLTLLMADFNRQWASPSCTHTHACLNAKCLLLPVLSCLSALKLSSKPAGSAWLPSAVEGVWTFPSCRPLAVVSWYHDSYSRPATASSEVPPCLLATQVTKWWQRPLRGRPWWHFWCVKPLRPTAVHMVLVAVMSKHVPSSNPRDIPRRPWGGTVAPFSLSFSLPSQKWAGKCWHHVKMLSSHPLAPLGTGSSWCAWSALPEFPRLWVFIRFNGASWKKK